MREINLFNGIDDKEKETLLKCLEAQRKTYEKDEIIMEDNMKRGNIGIVVSGNIIIYNEDFWGNRNIMAKCTQGDMFGEAFAGAGEPLQMSICTTERTEILFIQYEKIIRPCESACEFHNQMIVNLLEIISTKNIYLTRKIKCLSKRSIREKLLSFLSEQAQMNNSNAFEIKFDRQELADYLSVDRSAMSKELSKLKNEHILNYRKNWFQLLE